NIKRSIICNFIKSSNLRKHAGFRVFLQQFQDQIAFANVLPTRMQKRLHKRKMNCLQLQTTIITQVTSNSPSMVFSISIIFFEFSSSSLSMVLLMLSSLSSQVIVSSPEQVQTQGSLLMSSKAFGSRSRSAC